MSDAAGTAMQEADSTFIAPVPPPKLAKASGRGRMDRSSKRLRDHEWQVVYPRAATAVQYIVTAPRHRPAPRSGQNAPDDLDAGIALSGGGIRSATFALGVLQALAHHDLLRRFDYLSTVSGGGYLGCLADLADEQDGHQQANDSAPPFPADGFGLGPSREANGALGVDYSNGDAVAPFPYGTNDPREAPEPDGSRAEGAMLRYLRQHGNYLTPGKGITLTSVIVVLLRGIILNLLVWIPIIAAVMWLLIWAVGCLGAGYGLAWVPGRWRSSGRDLPASGGERRAGRRLAGAKGDRRSFRSASCWRSRSFCSRSAFSRSSSIRSPPYSVHRSVVVRAARNTAGAGLFERWMRVPFWAIGVLLLLASVPFVVGSLHGWLLGSSFSLIGLASGLLAFVRTMQQPKSQAEKQASWAIPSSWIASIGAGFLLYGVLLVSYAFGWWAAEGSPMLGVSPFWVLVGAFGRSPSPPAGSVDLNLITIHRFYRDRLMEAFLPDVDQALRNETARAQEADSAALSSMCDPARADRALSHHQHQPGADRVRRADLSSARRRQLHPVAALLRQQRDRLAADQRASWATS